MFSWASSLFGERSANEPVLTKTTDRGSIQQSGMESYAFSGMQGWRMTMEDAHMLSTNIVVNGEKSPLEGHAIFGVMDGHGGDFTSNFAAQHFMNTFTNSSHLKKYAGLTQAMQRDVPGLEHLRLALIETFTALDTEIRKRQNKRNDDVLLKSEKMMSGLASGNPRYRFERSGSTCVVVMITPSHTICANAGDSRAILRRGGRAVPLSFDHKPSNVPELERIEAAGGHVKSKRVDGDLAVSRGLGDFTYKSTETVSVENQKVIPHPEFVIYPRDRTQDEFLVLACDGVWDVATNEQCSAFVQDILDEGESDLGLLCEEALDICFERNSRDNMTLGIITFEGAKMARGLAGRNAVWHRRTARQARLLEESAKAVASRAAAGVGITI
eukprot:Nitzschia sp. Nitz4//scaffold63_size106090//44307//45461//NITZ4_004389-RA/size106090-processed-gene-0.141-mRNA-1//-1//CDS//3329555972//6833//frame0